MRYSWIPLPVRAACLAIVLAGCGSGADKTDDGPSKLAVATVSQGSVTRVVNASGKIVPRDEVMVGSEVSGRLLEVLVDFNSLVEEGQPLARIDPQTFRNRVRQLESRLVSAGADIKVRQASINRAEVNLSQARSVLERQQGLFAQEAVSEARLKEAERGVGVGEADLELAHAQLESADAQGNQIRAELASARLDLARTTIRSPITGVVIDRKVDPGQTVQASFSAPELFSIAADLSDIRVEAQIVESDVAGLEQGDMVKFTVDAYPDLSLSGTVEQLRLKSQEANNIVTYVAVVSARNDEGKLLPGMTANLEITTDVITDVLRVPALVERFRPTPEEIAAWEDAGNATTKQSAGLNDIVYTRLERIGLPAQKLASVRETIERATLPLRDVINDPEKSFAHTPTRIHLAELIENLLKTQLSPTNYSTYRALLAAERNQRNVTLWVKTPDSKMQRRQVKLGLSDAAYVHVISGLEADEEVVTGIVSGGEDDQRSNRRGQRVRG